MYNLASGNSSTFDKGDISFIIVSGALISFMIPGLALLYAGLAPRKSALSLIWIVCASNAIVILQWFLWGYSLAFSPSTTKGFIGNLAHIGMKGVMGDASLGSPFLPDLLFSFLQMEFAAVTVGIVVGAISERGRVMPVLIFSFLWTTLVYCPLACWAWNVNGWASSWGVVDFAGGGPVEIGSGMAGLAYSLVLGRRQNKNLSDSRPYNVVLVALGTLILWFGWIGFNAGSAFGANMRAIVAAWNSMLSAALGGMTWCLLDFCREKKWSMIGLCSGIVAGLVAATPSSGSIPLWASIIVGIAAGAICRFATKVKTLIRVDDALDIFAFHAVGGIVGLLANGIFADSTIVALDGVSHAKGGWIDRNWMQLPKQILYILCCCTYTFAVTYLLAKGLDLITGLHLRATEDAEATGMDETEIGESVSDDTELWHNLSTLTLTNRFGVSNSDARIHTEVLINTDGENLEVKSHGLSDDIAASLERWKLQPVYDIEKGSCRSAGISKIRQVIAECGKE